MPFMPNGHEVSDEIYLRIITSTADGCRTLAQRLGAAHSTDDYGAMTGAVHELKAYAGQFREDILRQACIDYMQRVTQEGMNSVNDALVSVIIAEARSYAEKLDVRARQLCRCRSSRGGPAAPD